VDGKEAGMQNSLGTPHIYTLSELLTPGKHWLTLCVDNRIKEIDPGVNSHSVSDHTQTNWNGIVGKLFLQARPTLFIENIQVFPDIEKRVIAVKIKLNNLSPDIQKSVLAISVENTDQPVISGVSVRPGVHEFNMDIPLREPTHLWSEFHPNLYNLNAVISS